MPVAFQSVGVASGNSAAPTIALAPAGANRLLLVAFVIEDPAGAGASLAADPAFGAQVMAQFGAAMFVGQVEAHTYRLVAPAVGAANVGLFFDAPVNYVAVAALYTGVHQAAPLGAPVTTTSTGTAPAATVPGTVDTSLVFDFVGVDVTTTVPTAAVHGGQVQRLNQVAGASPFRCMGLASDDAAGGDVSMGWLLSLPKPWIQRAVEIKAAPAGRVQGGSRLATPPRMARFGF